MSEQNSGLTTAVMSVPDDYRKAHGEAVTGQDERGGFHIPSLDGIRALSFLLVFIAHAGLGNVIPGGFGVTIFFFLSGYLITTLLRMEYDKTGAISFKGFYLRRTLRIFPPFYLVLFVASTLTAVGLLTGQLKLSALLAQTLYVGNYYAVLNGFNGIAPGTAIFWSLAIEEHFYLFFPLLYLVVRRWLPSNKHQMIFWSSVAAAVLIWRCYLVYVVDSTVNRTYIATDTRIDSILFGCILAIYGNPVLEKTRFSERIWLYVLAPLGVITLITSLTIRDALFRESLRYSMQGIALIPLFVVAIRYHQYMPFALLNLRWLRFMGVLSYSLYLVHQVYLYLLSEHTTLPTLVQASLALAFSLMTSILMHYTIEKPSAQMRRKLSKVIT